VVRDASIEDFPEIQEIHSAMGMDYALYDLNSPLLLVKKVCTDESGKVIGACLLRLTAETVLLLSPELEPAGKMTAMEQMQPEVLEAAWSKGLDEVEARIPTETEQIFEKRLRQLGWTRNRDGWHAWTRSTSCETR
jgi:hypothetical protein